MLKNLKSVKNISEIEEKILKFWQENKTFEKSLKKREKKPLFSFYDGPPFLSGKPHYGHILATVIKDAVTRFWSMKGFRVERRVGWDCHGLPVENLIEQKLNLKSKKDIEKMGIDKFNAACREYVFDCEKEFRETLQRVGRWADYSNAYYTLDNSYMESVWWVFKKIWDEKLIYKDFRVTPYCYHCGTPLSNFEVNQGYRSAEDPSVYVKFPVKGQKNTYLLVWTTTPWTLTANVAVAVNPKLTYTKFQVNGEYLWSYNLPPSINNKKIEVAEKISGKRLAGLEYEPLYKIKNAELKTENYYKVLPADFVSTEDGTGLVHIAPAFGEEDFNLIKKNMTAGSRAKTKKFEFPFTVDEEGKMREGVIGEGLFVKEADKVILEDLERRNLLYKKETILHQYPFCWRCDSPLLYYPLSTWYIAVTKIKSKLIKNNKKIHWVPEHIKEGRFGKWLAEARDWAFSRNRFWGAALPIWQCESCHKDTAIGSLKELAKLAITANNRYFLLRHGESEANHHNTLSCWPEQKTVHLTDKGRDQIEKVAKILKKKNIQLVFSSDLLRTKETSEIVSKEIKVPVKFDERLREYNFGIFNNGPRKEFANFFGNHLNKFLKTPQGGENLHDIRKRMMNFILELENKYKNKNILIISHCDPICVLQGASQGLGEKGIAEIIEKNPINAGELREIKFLNLPYTGKGRLNLHRPYIDRIELQCPECKGRAHRVSEVFDCWFESGAMPYAQWNYPTENKNLAEKAFPADFIAEGLDQTRGWFYTLHVLAGALTLKNIGLGKDKPASKNIVVNGLILDAYGKKLSKKSHNYVAPEIILNKFGADALRYFLLSSAQMGEDYQVSDKGVEEIFRKVIDKFKNIFSFLSLYVDEFNIKSPKIKTDNILDKWILARLNEAIKQATDKMEAYELTDASRVLIDFIDDLSNWYVRRSRKRFSDFAKNGESKSKKDFEQASAVLGYVILETSKLLAPFAPFISEAVYLTLTKNSVHLEDWPEVNKKLIDKNLLETMAEIRRIASLGLAKRLEAGIKVRQPLTSLSVKRQASSAKYNEELLNILKDEINVKEIIFDSKIKGEIELDTKLTPELKAEGTLRDLTRLVQGLRQDAGYQPKDRIILMIEGPAELNAILEKNNNFLKKEINAHEIELKHSDKFDAESSTKMGDWQIWIGVRII